MEENYNNSDDFGLYETKVGSTISWLNRFVHFTMFMQVSRGYTISRSIREYSMED